MKICSKCNQEKEFSLFKKNSGNKSGLHSYCVQCFKEYERLRYQNGDKARKDANKKKIKEFNQSLVMEYLLSHPCVDCGETDVVVLEFDHREDKVKNVSDMMFGSSKKLIEEISKCDVRCANDHRRRTAQQFATWRHTRV